MAAFTLTIADADVVRVTTALCRSAGFTNPADFTEAHALQLVMDFIQTTVNGVELGIAQQAALDAVSPPAPVQLS